MTLRYVDLMAIWAWVRQMRAGVRIDERTTVFPGTKRPSQQRQPSPQATPGFPGGRCLQCIDGLIRWEGRTYCCPTCHGFGKLAPYIEDRWCPARYYMGPMRGAWWERARWA